MFMVIGLEIYILIFDFFGVRHVPDEHVIHDTKEGDRDKG